MAARVSPQKVKAVADPLDADDDLLVVDVDVEDDAELDDDLLEEDGDDTVSLDDLADVASTDDDL